MVCKKGSVNNSNSSLNWRYWVDTHGYGTATTLQWESVSCREWIVEKKNFLKLVTLGGVSNHLFSIHIFPEIKNDFISKVKEDQ